MKSYSLKPTTFIFVSILFLASFTVSGQKASFIGTWNINQEKSQLGEGPGRRGASKMVITEVESNMVVERTSTRQSGETMTTKEIYNMTGTETDNSTENRKKKSVASWSADNKELTIKSTTTFERDGTSMEMKSTEVYKISDDKKTLTIDNTMSSQRGEFKTTLVYDLAQ
jgi:hypothetical protein